MKGGLILSALCSVIHGFTFKQCSHHGVQRVSQSGGPFRARSFDKSYSSRYVCMEVKRTPSILWNNSNRDSIDSNENSTPLGVFLEKASNTGLDNTSINVNSLVVTKYDVPEYGIFADQTYELKSVYLQGRKVNDDTEQAGNNEEQGKGVIEKILLSTLDLEGTTSTPAGYTRYISLYSPMYHDNDQFQGRAVIVTPEEVGLVSMKDEVLDSVLVAVPILSFWLGTIFVFAKTYHERTGGNFLDALFGR